MAHQPIENYVMIGDRLGEKSVFELVEAPARVATHFHRAIGCDA